MSHRSSFTLHSPGAPILIANKGILLLFALLTLWLTGTRSWAQPAFVLGGYVLCTALYLVLLSRLPQRSALVHMLGYGLDLGLTLYLIIASGGLTSPIWPLLIFEVLLPAFYLPWSWLTWVGAFASGPLYVLALWIQSGSLAFLPNPAFLIRYSLLFVAAIVTAFAVEYLQDLRQRRQELEDVLATREADLETQTKRLQGTAEDLGDRVLQLRSLQEVSRALAATLDLPDTLQVLVERLATLTSASYASLALLDQDGSRLQGVSASGPAADSIDSFSHHLDAHEHDRELLAAGNIVSSNDTDRLGFEYLRRLWQVDQFLCLPLVLRGLPMGAIYLADDRLDFDTDRQRQLLDSFSYFAAAAIENAQLYQTVADKNRELETILAGIGDGVLVVDADLRLLLMNPIAVEAFALEAVPPVGLPVYMILDYEPILQLLDEIKLTPGDAQMREIVLTPGGMNKERTYQALATPLMVGTNLQGIATVLRDVTGQKELERMKSNFLSVVSHELKTPLHSIKGFVDIILMDKTGPVTEIQRDFLETVKQQTDHLQRMIDDLLEFSRLESGRVTLRLQPADIPVVAEAVIDKLTPLADSAEVSLVNLVPEDLPTCSADPWRLEQVVTNLVDNAIKFTPPQGSVTIAAEESADFIQIDVHDTGIGITNNELNRIFDRFYQVDGGANRLYKGAGLGLTICRHIVEHHGGHIWVESAQHEGATFSFTISKNLQSADVGTLDFTTLPQEQKSDDIII